MKKWMIYGANGYTGERIAHEAKKRGLTPVLAGRNEQIILSLAKELGFEGRVFDLKDPIQIAEHLTDIDTVLLCAGPFSATSQPMLEACLRVHANYLDITGEIAVFEKIQARSAQIKNAGIVAIPGVGFDVVPTDCLAAMLKDKLPQAVDLQLAIKPSGGMSPGTTKTTIEGLSKGGAVRQAGKITSVPTAHKTIQIKFTDKPEWAAAVPWGDVSTAYHSTKIPNIEVYVVFPRAVIGTLKLLNVFKSFFGLKSVQSFLKKMVTLTVKGPSAQTQEKNTILLWGKATDGAGKSIELRMSIPEGYLLTVDAALEAVLRVRKNFDLKGALTPSLAFGKDFVLGLKNVRMIG